MMRYKETLISRPDSLALKGLLILLIVLGHNSILMDSYMGRPNALYYFLYHFHVYCFLILPFLYNIPDTSKTRFAKDFFHLYKPYTFLFIILIIYNYLFTHNLCLEGIFCAYVSGNEPILKKYLGASFPWFLPTMFSLLQLRNYATRNRYIMWLLLVMSAIVFIMSRIFNIFSLYDFNIFLGFIVALAYYSMSMFARLLYTICLKKPIVSIVICGISVISSITFFVFASTPKHILLAVNEWIIMPISIFIALITIIPLIQRSRIAMLFRCLGEQSLPIYVIHLFVYYVILMIVEKIVININLIVGLVVYLLTILVTVSIIKAIKNFKIYKVIFN